MGEILYVLLNISPQIKCILRFHVYQCLFSYLFQKCEVNIYCVIVMNETTMIPDLMNLAVMGRSQTDQKTTV